MSAHPTAERSNYLDDVRYAELAGLERRIRVLGASTDTSLRQECAAFLAYEARLLDDRRFADWVELLADDLVYWLPITPGGGTPRDETTITLDDRRRILDRVAWIGTGKVRADLPFRTRRSITNVEAFRTAPDRVLVLSTFSLVEHRHRVVTYAGRYVHELCGPDGQWRVRTKQALLIDSDQNLENVTFIF